MEERTLYRSDYRFMSIIWDNGPLSVGRLCGLCRTQLGWADTAVSATLKRLEAKGFLKVECDMAVPLITREQVRPLEGDYLVNRFHRRFYLAEPPGEQQVTSLRSEAFRRAVLTALLLTLVICVVLFFWFRICRPL